MDVQDTVIKCPKALYDLAKKPITRKNNKQKTKVVPGLSSTLVPTSLSRPGI